MTNLPFRYNLQCTVAVPLEFLGKNVLKRRETSLYKTKYSISYFSNLAMPEESSSLMFLILAYL